MAIKKANMMAKTVELGSQVHPIQHMLENSKKCMSTTKIFTYVIFLVVIFLFGSTATVYASVSDGIDRVGNTVYFLLVNIGKWIIVFKGAIDIIQCVISGDFQTAKKLFMGYVLAFGVLYALPWAFSEIESIFEVM